MKQMKYLSAVIIVLISLMTIDSFGQEIMARGENSKTATQKGKAKMKVGAFGEIIGTSKVIKEDPTETNKKQTKYYDFVDRNSTVCGDEDSNIEDSEAVDFMEIMVAEERNPQSKQESFLFHSSEEITNESGFFIQLLESNQILKKEHRIYQEFGNLRVKNNSGDSYSYLIGKFLTEETGNKFLNDIILPRYPEAKLIKLNEGKVLSEIK